MNRIIPKGWKKVKLKELCRSKPDYGLNAPAVNYNPLLPLYLRITDITSDGLYDHTNAVSVEYHETEKLLSRNDFLFARTGATVGKTYLHKDIGKRIAFAGYLIRFVIDQLKIIPYFLKLYCQTIYYLNWVRIYSLRSGQPGINAEEYSNLIILLPPLSEQATIVNILSEWDKAIDLVSHKIELKEQLKKGLMQRLLTGKVRLKGFNGEWEKNSLSCLATINKGQQLGKLQMIDQRIYPVLNGGINFSGYTNHFNTNENTIAISEGGNSCGFVSYIKQKFWSGGHCYTLSNLKTNSNFLYQLLKLNESFIMNLRVGSGLPNIQKSSLENYLLNIPQDLAEQTAIAEVLTTADDEISLLKKQLESLKLQKKGLMQKLLTGEWSTRNIKLLGDEK